MSATLKWSDPKSQNKKSCKPNASQLTNKTWRKITDGSENAKTLNYCLCLNLDLQGLVIDILFHGEFLLES